MLSPIYGECHTSGKRLQPVTKISLCQISVGKSVCNGFPDRLGFRTSLEITFWAIPKQSHSRVSPSTLTTKRSSPLLSAYAPFSRLGDKFLHCLFLRRVLHLFIVQCQRRHRRRNQRPPAAKDQTLRGARLKALLALDYWLFVRCRSCNSFIQMHICEADRLFHPGVELQRGRSGDARSSRAIKKQIPAISHDIAGKS